MPAIKATALAPAKPTTQIKPKPKTETKPKLPTLSQMILKAVETLEQNEKKGVTRQSIAKYITATYLVNADVIKKLSKGLNTSLESGIIRKMGKNGPVGANGRFKTNPTKSPSAKAAAPRAPRVPKVPKAAPKVPKAPKVLALPKVSKPKASPKPKPQVAAAAASTPVKATVVAGRGRPAKKSAPSKN